MCVVLLRRWSLVFTLSLAVRAGLAAPPETPVLPLVTGVELQPLAAQVSRVVEALEALGAPLPASERQALEAASSTSDAEAAVTEIQRILDPHCLVSIDINPEMRVKVAAGPAAKELVESG